MITEDDPVHAPVKEDAFAKDDPVQTHDDHVQILFLPKDIDDSTMTEGVVLEIGIPAVDAARRDTGNLPD